MTNIDLQIKLMELELEFCPDNWAAQKELQRLKEFKENNKKDIDTQ